MKIWMLVLMIAVSSELLANPIYKSTDSNGGISYSASVPDNSRVLEWVDPIPQPTEQQVLCSTQDNAI